MNNTEIRDALYKLQQMEFLLDEEYENNGGEVTDFTEHQEESIAALRELLTTEGVDSLGRWLKSKEDEIKTLKAEKDAVTRKINAVNNTIDYIKTQINMLMTQTGVEKVKGTFYSFAPITSVKTEVDKELLKALYEDKVKTAMIQARIPAYVGVTLTASSTKAKEFGVVEGDEGLFTETTSPSVRFTKPRASKEEK